MPEAQTVDNVLVLPVFHSERADFLRRRLAMAIERDDRATVIRLTYELNQVLNGPLAQQRRGE